MTIIIRYDDLILEYGMTSYNLVIGKNQEYIIEAVKNLIDDCIHKKKKNEIYIKNCLDQRGSYAN